MTTAKMLCKRSASFERKVFGNALFARFGLDHHVDCLDTDKLRPGNAA